LHVRDCDCDCDGDGPDYDYDCDFDYDCDCDCDYDCVDVDPGGMRRWRTKTRRQMVEWDFAPVGGVPAIWTTSILTTTGIATTTQTVIGVDLRCLQVARPTIALRPQCASFHLIC
jgi:hypothetical protein